MTTKAQLRKATGDLAGVTEHAEGKALRFEVGGAAFVILTEDAWVELVVPNEEAKGFLADIGTGEPLKEGRAKIGVRVPIADINGQALNYWVRRAWASQAPSSLVDAAEDAASAKPGEVGDLPKSLGAPATRALVSAGIRSVQDAADYGIDRLSGLRGVGPKAVRLLRDATGG